MKKSNDLQWFVMAGLVAGLAEVAWIGIYSYFTDVQAAAIAGAITATVLPGSVDPALSPWLGLAIHLVLSIGLAIAFGRLVWPLASRLHAGAGTFIASVVVLALVWKINFFVILPVWNAGFIELLPMEVTFVSKMMFGVAMGLVLMMPRRWREKPVA